MELREENAETTPGSKSTKPLAATEVPSEATYVHLSNGHTDAIVPTVVRLLTPSDHSDDPQELGYGYAGSSSDSGSSIPAV
jgi:hypothetical protein